MCIRDSVKMMDCYTEWSPGGDGLRMFCLAQPMDREVVAEGVELYTSRRFLTVTGVRYVA